MEPLPKDLPNCFGCGTPLDLPPPVSVRQLLRNQAQIAMGPEEACAGGWSATQTKTKGFTQNRAKYGALLGGLLTGVCSQVFWQGWGKMNSKLLLHAGGEGVHPQRE